MTGETILLCGGTGQLGFEIATRLAADGVPFRALVRPATDASPLARLGAEVVRGDFRDAPSIDAALAGVNTVMSTANTMRRQLEGDRGLSIRDVDDRGYATLIDACDRAGAGRFVFASMLGDFGAARTPFTDAKLATERRLHDARLREVIVRADMFQEEWFTPLVGFDWTRQTVTVYGRGESRHAYVAIGDVAQAMVRLALLDDPPRVIDLAGPEALSRIEAVQAFERAMLRDIRVHHVPRPMLAAGKRLLRGPRPALASVMGMALAGDLESSSAGDAGFRSLGIRARPVGQYIVELARAVAGQDARPGLGVAAGGRGRGDAVPGHRWDQHQQPLGRSAGTASERLASSRTASERAAAPRRRAASQIAEAHMIVVVGSSGTVGGEVCRRLAAHGRQVRAVVRVTTDAAKGEALRAIGAEVVVADLRDQPSLIAALAGADAVITTVSSMPFSYLAGENDIQTTDLAGMRHLVDAARAAGVRHLVYTSFSGNIDVDMPLGRAKRASEAYLRSSGLGYTILRPSYFQEIWLSPAVGFDARASTATVYGDGTAPISWIALGDVAEFAVRSLDEPAARNAILELGGPEALSPMEVIRTFERASNTKFVVTHVPEAALEAQQAASSDPMAQSFTAMMRAYAHGDAIEMLDLLARIPVALTSVASYASRVVGPAPAGAAT